MNDIVIGYFLTVSLFVTVLVAHDNWGWFEMTYDKLVTLLRRLQKTYKKAREDWTAYNSQKKE